jgi:hypothetical protein
MKASSSLLEAFVGGVFAFSDPSPRIASQEPAKVTPNVAMASCERSLDDIGDFEVYWGRVVHSGNRSAGRGHCTRPPSYRVAISTWCASWESGFAGCCLGELQALAKFAGWSYKFRRELLLTNPKVD